ncbi:MAG: hypothetical protein QNJ11_14035 [Woeseiaceae bacterium]|nr:hypothetical protein [Woeseiaceae bacterium]
MTLRASTLVKDMLAAARAEVGERWPDIKVYAEAEAKKLAQTLVMIEKLKVSGRISKKQADILLDMQKQTSRVVLLTIEGLSLLAAEAAVNAAMKSIRDAVNDAIGWRLI